MKATAYYPPYRAHRKTSFIGSRWQSGVYLIKEDGVLVYVGFAGECLYRTFYRHFQNWTHKHYHSHKVAPAPYRVSYRSQMGNHTYEARLIHCSPKRAARLEKCLIIKHDPRDNRMKYQKYELDKWDTRVMGEYEDLANDIDCMDYGVCTGEKFVIGVDVEDVF